MVPSLLSYAIDSCSDFLIHLTLLRSVRCIRTCTLWYKKLNLGVFVPLQKLENGLLGGRGTSWIRAGRELSEPEAET